MYTPENFERAIELLARLNNLPLDLAGELMVSIGDTPLLDENGLVIAHAEDGAEHRVV